MGLGAIQVDRLAVHFVADAVVQPVGEELSVAPLFNADRAPRRSDSLALTPPAEGALQKLQRLGDDLTERSPWCHQSHFPKRSPSRQR